MADPLATGQSDTLGVRDVRAWYRSTTSIEDAELAHLVEILSTEERERYHRFVFAEDRRDFAAAHALLRQVLSRYGDAPPSAWRFETGPRGKPALIGPTDLTFNLSHTRGLVACAVGRHAELGIDVESARKLIAARDIATRYFSAIEIHALGLVPPHQYHDRFLELWTLKEAYIKALGLGLSRQLDTFSFVLEGERRLRLDAPGETELSHWQFALAAPSPESRLAVAAGLDGRHDGCRIVIRDADCPGARPLALIRSAPSMD